ncbi:MAG: hypothetical protein JWQ23_4180 [Herminiimonas sp.]|nr:hypothetical protein [Herminiimonas sp.]
MSASASFRCVNINTIVNSGVMLISKLVTITTMWLGAKFVIEGGMSISIPLVA